MKNILLALCLIITSCSSNQKELHIYTWGDYISTEVIEQFEKKFECRVIVDTYDSNESMYAKLKAGATGYDLIFPSNYFLDLLDKQQMLQPIHLDHLTNIQNLDRHLLKIINADVNSTSIPYMISFSGIGYRSDRIAEMDDSWNAFGQKRWRGRMTMLNDYRETIGAGLKYLGYSINTKEGGEIDEAANQVIAWKKNLAKFDSEQYKNGIATAEFLIVQGYSGDILQVMAEDEGVNFIYPTEGATISCDYLAIPRYAKDPNLAHAFINFLYEPAVSAKNIEHTLFICPNREAYPLLPEYLAQNPVLFPSEATLKKAELLLDVGADVVKYYEAWDKIKSSNGTL